MSKERLRKLPAEMKKALDDARRATRSCVAMRAAISLEESLSIETRLKEEMKKLQDGPDSTKLLGEVREKAVDAIDLCRELSVSGLEDSFDGRYAVLRTYFSLAEAACQKCQPRANKGNCPAAEILEKVNLNEKLKEN